MALLPVPVTQPPSSLLSVMEVHLQERQCLPHLLVFSEGSTSTLFQHREVPLGVYSTDSSNPDLRCLGVTIDAKPACALADEAQKIAVNQSQQRVAVAVNGVVTLLCPHTQMNQAHVGDWVEVDLKSKAKSRFRGYGEIEVYDFTFTRTPSILKGAEGTSAILVGRLLIKDITNNYITIDLCPL